MNQQSMKIVIAPNALKGSLSAIDASKAIKRGVLRVLPDAETICIPIADGGDGMLDVIQSVMKAQVINCNVTGPLGKPVLSRFLYNAKNKLAVIELALASGVALLEATELDINRASTSGVGELIREALSFNIQHLILGVGGSATHDAAMGIASILGVKFLDKNGCHLAPCGRNLIKVHKIDIGSINHQIGKVKIDLICDVKNPLLGHQGAAAEFARQKGANNKDIINLEAGTRHFAARLEQTFSKNVREIESGGAAGGVGAGMYAMFNANLRQGADVIFNLLELDKHLLNADLLITAEGKLDSQSQFGKGTSEAAILAKKFDVPTGIIAGQVESGHYPEFQHIVSLTSSDTSSTSAIKYALDLIEKKSEELIARYADINLRNKF